MFNALVGLPTEESDDSGPVGTSSKPTVAKDVKGVNNQYMTRMVAPTQGFFEANNADLAQRSST